MLSHAARFSPRQIPRHDANRYLGLVESELHSRNRDFLDNRFPPCANAAAPGPNHTTARLRIY